MKKHLLNYLLPLFACAGLALFINPVYSQTYCVPTATNDCTSALGNPAINNFTLDSINNSTDCSANSYGDYSSPITYPNIETTLVPGQTYTFSITRGHSDYASPYSRGVFGLMAVIMMEY